VDIIVVMVCCGLLCMGRRVDVMVGMVCRELPVRGQGSGCKSVRAKRLM